MLIVISCNHKENKKLKEVEVSKENKTEQIKTVSESTEIISDLKSEKFMEFFEKFMWDTLFQQERIKYPLTINNITIGNINFWKHIPFYIGKSYMPILNNDTITIWDKDNLHQQAVISILKFEDNTTTNYNFEQLYNGWHLTSIKKDSAATIADFQFLKFIKDFSKDSLFQISHVKFPFPNIYIDWELDDPSEVCDSIQYKDWRHMNLIKDLDDLFIIQTDTNTLYRSIYLRGIDNGISIEYHFERINGNWNFVKVEDYSS